MSPINKISIPIKPTSKIISKIGLFKELKYGLSIDANRITIAIFIKLLEIRIVASNLFGFSSRTLIFLIILLPSSLGILDLSSEKNATSHPEVRADNIRKIKIKIIFTITKI